MGWPEQISRLAKRRSLDWMEVYLLVSFEVLGAAAEGQDTEQKAAAGGGRDSGHEGTRRDRRS
jgi:hypothetical protein